MDNLICIVDQKLDIGEKKISKKQQKFNEANFERKKTGNIVSVSVICSLLLYEHSCFFFFLCRENT